MKLSQKNLLLLRQGQNLNRNGLKRPKEESKGHPRPAKSAIPKTLPQNGQMNLLPPMNDKLPPPSRIATYCGLPPLQNME